MDAEHVLLERLLPLRLGHRCRVAGRRSAGVVDDDIQTAQVLDRGRHEASRLAFAADVRRNRMHAHARVARDRGGCLLDATLVAAADDEIAPFPCQRPRTGIPQPATRGHDQRPFPF
jgi:hypothetical protein